MKKDSLLSPGTCDENKNRKNLANIRFQLSKESLKKGAEHVAR